MQVLIKKGSDLFSPVVKKKGKKVDPEDVNVGEYEKLEDTPYYKAESTDDNE